MDEEVCSLLNAWGLEQYVDTFKEHNITSMSLPLLKEPEIRELFAQIGPRAIFSRNLEIWRKTMHPDASCTPTYENPINDINISFSEFFSPLEPQAAGGGSPKEPLASTSRLSEGSRTPITVTIPQSNVVHICDLPLLLNDTLEGKGLLNLDKSVPLDNSARLRLVRIIATNILQKNPNALIRSNVYASWAHEIVKVFPQEKVSVYCHSKIVDSTRGIITRLAGKLPDQIHNLKRKYRDSGILAKRQRTLSSDSGSSSKSTPPASPALRLPEEVERSECGEETLEDLQWLKNSSDPWANVVQKWEKTTHARLKLSKEMPIAEYFKEYPALQKPTGYLLLEKDFDAIYPKQTTNIFDTFPLLKVKIFDVASKRSSGRDKFLQQLLSLQNSTEESSTTACLLLIPSLLAVSTVRLKTGNKKVWRPSKNEVRDGFITHVQTDTDIKTVISNRRDKFKDLGLTLQPFVIVVGPSLNEIKSNFVVLNDLLYLLPNILSAVNTCFKITWVINAQYPVECHSTWMFIQHAFYKLQTKFDSQSTAAHTLLAELGID